MKNLKIAIDGHSSCGKSTVAKQIAQRFGFTYIDTGAMYRCATLLALRNNAISGNNVDESIVLSALDLANIDFEWNPDLGRNITFLNGEKVEDEIRGLEVANLVSEVSKLKAVRTQLVDMQRKMSANKSVVMDGRDIGSAVLPNAPLKIFMTADKRVRALRRYRELQNSGVDVSLEEVMANIEKQRKAIKNVNALSTSAVVK